MAVLKDTLITGNLRVTDTILTDTVQADAIKVNESASSSTKSTGTSGQVIMSDGENTYWGTVATSDVNVTQTATTTSANYEVLLSGTADNTTRTEGARKNSNLTFNPSTGNLQTTQLNGVTVGSSPKFTDTTYSSKTAASGGTDVSLVTTGEKYTWNNKGVGTITQVGNTSSGAVTVSSSNNTAAFDSAVTVGSVGGVDLKFTMPSNPIKGVKIFYGTCATAAATAAKVVVCPEFTENDLDEGTIIYVKFSNANSAAVADLTLNVNSTGAFGIKKVYNSSLTNLTATGEIRATVYQFMIHKTEADGVITICWKIDGLDYNSDNTVGYVLRTNYTLIPTRYKFYRYRLLFCSPDNTELIPANTSTSTNATATRDVVQDKINPFGPILYYATTTAVNAGANPSTAYLRQQTALTLGYSFNRTGAALTLSVGPVYLKCAPQTDGSAIIDADNPYVQSLPSTEDGKIYIYLGQAYNATEMELVMCHPIYYYKNGAIRMWTGVNSVSDILDGTSTQFVKGDGSLDSNSYLPANQAMLSVMQDDATHRTVTDADKTNWNSKQSALISGSNIKTINNTSILGSGNISIPSGKSAYEIWLDEGNTGSVSDFLASLKGSSGYSGAANELQVVNDLTTGGATAALSAEMGKLLASKVGVSIESEEVDLTSLSVVTGYFIQSSTQTWQSGSTRKYILVPVSDYSKVRITSQDGAYTASLAWLKSNSAPVINATPDFASGTQQWTQAVNTTEEYTVPDDAIYMYIFVERYYPVQFIGISYNGDGVSPTESEISINTNSENDFEITDANSNPIVVFNNGHIKTLNFDSSKLEKLHYTRRNFFTYNVNTTNFLTTNFTATNINYYDAISLYEDNAILYLPSSYSNQGTKTKLIIYCKEGSTYMTEDHDSILTNPEVTRYFLYLGYAILAADGVPDGWKEALGLSERVVGNYVAVQSTLRAFEYVKNNYNIDCDNVFIFGYSQGGCYAENVIDNTDLPIRAAVLLSPVLSVRYHQWDANLTGSVDGVSYTRLGRLNVARMFDFPQVSNNTQLLALEYDADKLCGYDPWVRNVENVYTGFVQESSYGSSLWCLPSGTSLDSITMKKHTKCPTKIWACENDNVVGVDVTKVFVKAIKNSGQVADLQLYSTGEHHPHNYQTAIRTFVENGENVSLLPMYLDMAAWYYNFGGLALK